MWVKLGENCHAVFLATHKLAYYTCTRIFSQQIKANCFMYEGCVHISACAGAVVINMMVCLPITIDVYQVVRLLEKYMSGILLKHRKPAGENFSPRIALPGRRLSP